MSNALLIMAHGSRSETANQEFCHLVDAVARSARQAGQNYTAVKPCFLELAEPSLEAAVAPLVEQSITRVQLYPLFFNRGKHVARDIPAQVQRARERFPDLTIELLDYFGSASGVAPLVLEHIAEQIG